MTQLTVTSTSSNQKIIFQALRVGDWFLDNDGDLSLIFELNGERKVLYSQNRHGSNIFRYRIAPALEDEVTKVERVRIEYDTGN